MEEMYAMIGGNRSLLLQYSTETIEAMDGEADIVITKATDVIFTKDDEGDTQIFPEQPSPDEDITSVSSRAHERALTKSNSSTSPGPPPKKQTKESTYSCDCLASSARVPPHLDPGHKASSPRFSTHFIRRCSNPECPARKAPSRGSLILSAKKFKQIIGISLKARSFHSLMHIEYEGTAQEDTEAVIFTTTRDTRRLRRLLESGVISVRERNADNWTLLHVSYEVLIHMLRLIKALECCIFWNI